MIRRLRLCLFAAALAAGAAHAQLLQTQIGVSPALEVQRLAPQLVPFAGSEVNFENLVNGLALGLPVTLTTPLAAGQTQLVSFTPVGTMSPQQIAQTLESARQVAIANGIAAPTAQQLGVILNGGALSTAAGTATVNGLMGGAAPLSTTVAGTPSVATQLQSTPRFARSDSPLPRGVADSTLTAPLSTSPAPATAPGL
ncbi:MAG TPA: hypothetical protein VFI86_03790, partial [Burkholderiales bacterium]|nr:hypothetical protein [Burkholderiales bacterium]